MRFARFEALAGETAARSISQKTVLVAGLGGVGSYALEALARSGVGTLLIIDHDVVDITNLNRQILALESTVGKLKVVVAEQRLKDINPALRVLAYPVFLDASNLEGFLDRKIDFIVDAIDSVDSKVLLIQTALRKGIPIISSMGFAKKLHPELIRLATLKETAVCPLAKTMRLRLKNEAKAQDLPVVFSTETPVASLDPGVKLGSAATVPSVAGLFMASYVINQFIEASKETSL